jgi:HSP20 family molecular chaperone IbpA
MNGKYYFNNNGKVSEGTFDADEFNFESAVKDLFLGTGDLFAKALGYTPRRFDKSDCPNAFPPSNKYIDSETKDLHIDIAACGISENDFRVEVDNDIIRVTFGKSKEAKESRLYSHKGLKLITDEVLPFKFDPRFHDISTAKVTLENGVLSITLSPRDEVKPINKVIGGNLKTEEITEN